MLANELSYRSLIKDELQQTESLLLQPSEDALPVLKNAIQAVINGGGKRLRPALTILTAYLCHADAQKSITLAAAIEMLHTATLIHDDFIDDARIRRGTETLNAHWPPAATVLAGDLVFSWAAQLISQVNTPKLMQRFAETLTTICTGELNQMFKGRGQIPTQSAYYERIREKTASLFIIATEGAAILANCPEEECRALACFGDRLGLAFQIADDVLDFMSTSESLGKPVGSDLRQGLVTLPVLVYMEKHPKDPRLKMLLTDTTSEALLQAVIADLRSSDAAEQAMVIAETQIQQALDILKAYPSSPYRDAIEEIAIFAIHRRY